MQTGRNYQPYRARMTDQNDVTIVVRRPVIFIMLTAIWRNVLGAAINF